MPHDWRRTGRFPNCAECKRRSGSKPFGLCGACHADREIRSRHREEAFAPEVFYFPTEAEKAAWNREYEELTRVVDARIAEAEKDPKWFEGSGMLDYGSSQTRSAVKDRERRRRLGVKPKSKNKGDLCTGRKA